MIALIKAFGGGSGGVSSGDSGGSGVLKVLEIDNMLDHTFDEIEAAGFAVLFDVDGKYNISVDMGYIDGEDLYYVAFEGNNTISIFTTQFSNSYPVRMQAQQDDNISN